MSKILGVVLVMALSLMITSCDEFINAINDNPVSPSLTIKTEKLTVKVGETVKCKFTVSTMAVMKFQSADTSIATVDDQGNVTGVKEGKTTITLTVTTYDANKTWKNNVFSDASATIDVEVIAADAEEDEDEETKEAAKVTTAPTATAGDIIAGSTTALVTAGAASGGTMMYKATAENTKPTSTDGFSATIPTAEELTAATYYVWYYAKGDDGYTDSEIAASAIAVEVTANLAATPLTLEAITAGTIVVNNPKSGMKYSKNGGAKTAVTTTAIDVAVGDKVAFYGNGTSISTYSDGTTSTTFGGAAQVKVYGNIMSLVDETGYETATALTANNTFKELFKGNAQLTDISDLLLPATTLAGACYYFMFQGCTNLAAAPKELPATTLAEACYYSMFKGCTSLTTIPEALLPATTLAGHCYQNMFQDCTGLTTLPEKLLPATEMKPSCYATMFYQCTGLTTLPEKLLPAETLANNCYHHLFQGCTSLTTAPALPATTLADCCYSLMFYGCKKLEQTPHLAAETSALKKECYYYMFGECKGLTKAYVKANYTDATDVNQCGRMFNGCTNASTSTFYSDDAANWKSHFGALGSWQTAAYPTE